MLENILGVWGGCCIRYSCPLFLITGSLSFTSLEFSHRLGWLAPDSQYTCLSISSTGITNMCHHVTFNIFSTQFLGDEHWSSCVLGKYFTNFKAPSIIVFGALTIYQKWKVSGWLLYCMNRDEKLNNISQLFGNLGSTEHLSLQSDYTEIPKSKLQMEVYRMLKTQQQIISVMFSTFLHYRSQNKIKSLNTNSAVCQGLQLLLGFVGNTNEKSNT